MCGICGIVKTSPLTKTEIQLVRGMNEKMKHRGPDSEGYYSEEQISLAMRRLSIIDLVSGDQPLFSEDKTIVLIANGEIYNFIELRRELEIRGHSFTSNSDSEIIIHAYEEYGLGCLKKFRGMFSFVLYDKKQQKIFLGRDRMGEKPFYYIKKGDSLIFASEMKVISLAINDPSVDHQALDFYLTRFCFNESGTLIKQVAKIEPANYLIFDLKNGNIKKQRYWDPLAAPEIKDDPIEAVREKLLDVMSIIVRSDVPVGVSLSGGLDSSAVAILAQKNIGRTVKAFCVGYPGEPEFDERYLARKLAKELNMTLYEDELKVDELTNDFPQLVYLMDDPVADISAYGYYRVMALAREQGVPVVLSGFGGDELFWGYPWVAEVVGYANRHYLNPNILTKFFDFVSGNIMAMQSNHIFCLRRFMFQRQARVAQNVYSKAFRQKITKTILAAVDMGDSRSVQGRIINELFKYWLFSDLNVLGDRLSMASSVEMRLPFLDHQLVETVFGILKAQPDNYLAPTKQLLKDALKDFVSKEIIERKKRGFQPPVREWQNAIINNYQSVLDKGYLVSQGLLNKIELKRLINDSSRYGEFNEFIYRTIIFELWYKQVVLKNSE